MVPEIKEGPRVSGPTSIEKLRLWLHYLTGQGWSGILTSKVPVVNSRPEVYILVVSEVVWGLLETTVSSEYTDLSGSDIFLVYP